MERVELGPKKLHGRAYGAWVKAGAGSIQAWTNSRWTKPVQRNIYRLWLVFHSFLKKILSLLLSCSRLSPLSYLLLRRKRAAAGEWFGGGWPSGTTAPPPITPKRNLFYLFFYIFSSSFPSLYSILNPKSRNTNPKLLDLKKTKGKKEKKTTFVSSVWLVVPEAIYVGYGPDVGCDDGVLLASWIVGLASYESDDFALVDSGS